MRAKNLSGIVMRISVILLCLVLFSSHLASGMFARYTVSDSEGGNAHAAKYGVKIVAVDDGDPLSLSNINGDVSYRFKVDNANSEVAVKYETLQIAFSDCYADVDGTRTKVSEVKDMVRDVKLFGKAGGNDVEYGCTDIIEQDNGVVYVFAVYKMLRPGSSSPEFTLKFNTFPSWEHHVDDNLDDNTIRIDNRYKYPVSIFADAVQID